MRSGDLDLVTAWMAAPHISRWYLAHSSAEEELDELRRCITGEEATHALTVTEDGREIGWCQWYRCRDYPEHAAGVGAAADDIGIDYAIGDSSRLRRGLGTALIAVLVAEVRQRHAGVGLVADPEVSNLASRRVLEKNGFVLQGERVVPSEKAEATMAIYRLSPNRMTGR